MNTKDKVQLVLEALEEKVSLVEKPLGLPGKIRVRNLLLTMVNKYIKMLEPMSDDSDNNFFMRDFANWLIEYQKEN